MPFPRFVLHIAYKYRLVGEPCSQFLRIVKRTSAIVSHIYDKGSARLEVEKNVVEVARSYSTLETFATQLANVVVENGIVQSARYQVIGFQVFAQERIGIVLRIVFAPRPIACSVERGV